jgi:hypothetical protein
VHELSDPDLLQLLARLASRLYEQGVEEQPSTYGLTPRAAPELGSVEHYYELHDDPHERLRVDGRSDEEEDEPPSGLCECRPVSEAMSSDRESEEMEVDVEGTRSDVAPPESGGEQTGKQLIELRTDDAPNEVASIKSGGGPAAGPPTHESPTACAPPDACLTETRPSSDGTRHHIPVVWFDPKHFPDPPPPSDGAIKRALATMAEALDVEAKKLPPSTPAPPEAEEDARSPLGVAWSTFRCALPSLTYEEAWCRFDSHLAVRGFRAQRQELREREEERLRARLAEGEILHSKQDVELAAGDTRTVQFFAYYSGHEPGQRVLLTSLAGPERVGADGQNPLGDKIRLGLGEARLVDVPPRRGTAGDPRSCVRLRASNHSADDAVEPMVIPAGTAYARLRLGDPGVAATRPRRATPEPWAATR